MITSIYLLFILLTYGSADVVLWSDPTHCPAACTQCPASAPEVCVVTPILMQFTCVCMVHHALCNGFAQNVVFYVGKCNSRPHFHLDHLEMTLYTFRGMDITPIRVREPSKVRRPSIPPAELEVPRNVPQKLVRIQNTPNEVDGEPQLRIMDLRGSNRRSISGANVKVSKPTVNNTEICSMFFKEDKKFQKMYKMKHFECSNANPSMVQKIPLDQLENETS